MQEPEVRANWMKFVIHGVKRAGAYREPASRAEDSQSKHQDGEIPACQSNAYRAKLNQSSGSRSV